MTILKFPYCYYPRDSLKSWFTTEPFNKQSVQNAALRDQADFCKKLAALVQSIFTMKYDLKLETIEFRDKLMFKDF